MWEGCGKDMGRGRAQGRDRQAGSQAGRQAGKEAGKHAGKQAGKQACKHSEGIQSELCPGGACLVLVLYFLCYTRLEAPSQVPLTSIVSRLNN